ncbi:MAG: hypothetical protein GY861_02775 [bacterium]|nr:hypothetical protein [bacterium]
MPLPDYVQQASQSGLPDYVKNATKGEPKPTTGVSGQWKTEDPTIAERYGKVKEKAVERIETAAKFGDDNPAMKVFAPMISTLPGMNVGVGQTAGVLNDVTGELIAELTPTKVKEWATDKITEAVGSPTVAGFALDIIGKGEKAWNKFKEEHKDFATLIEGNVNVGMLLMYGGGGPKATKKIASEVADTASDVTKALSKARTPKYVEKILQSEVKGKIEKGIKPNLTKFGAEARNNYFKRASAAVEDLVENKNSLKIVTELGEETGKLPETMGQFQQLIGQRKAQIFKAYDDISKGTRGTVDTGAIRRLLRVFKNNKTIKLSPETVKYAEQRMGILKEGGELTATEVQNHMQFLNHSLKAYNANPSQAAWGHVQVDLLIKQNLQKILERQIAKQSGSKYSELKKLYGNLKTIEQDVNRAVNRIANAAEHNVLDVGTDVFASHQSVAAIARMDPTLLTAAAAAKGTRWWSKHLMNPDRKIRLMFKNAEKIIEKKKSLVPKSYTGKATKKSIEETKDAYPFIGS